jgi:hypothetical protein
LNNQQALRDSIETMVKTRQGSLVAKEIERLRTDTSYDAQKMLNKIYEAKEGENVYKVFSFDDNFKDKAKQLGDDTAFDLGRDINETFSILAIFISGIRREIRRSETLTDN